jgi:hypothetical protein
MTEVTTNELELVRQIKELAGDRDFQKLLATLEESVAPKLDRTLSKNARRAEWDKELEEIPEGKLADLEVQMESYVHDYFNKIRMSEPRELSQEEIDSLAQEYTSWQVINDALQSRYRQFRQIVFTSLTESFAKEIEDSGLQTETPPEQMKGSLASTKFGVRFCREGGGRGRTKINAKTLESSLPEELYRSVCQAVEVPQVVIPAHTEYTLDENLLMEAISEGRIDLESIREAVVPGEWTTPKFQVRKG